MLNLKFKIKMKVKKGVFMKNFFNKFSKLFHSFRNKILFMLLILGILPLLVTGIVTYNQSTNILNKKLETTSTQTIQEVGRGIDNYIDAMSNLVTVLSNDVNIIEANDDYYFGFAKGLIANIRESDESILNVYVGTESKMFYAFPEVELVGYDPTATAWYKESVEYPDQVVFSDPYTDTGTGLMVMSLTKAITKGNELIGVVGLDIGLDKLSDDLSSIKIGDTGYVYMSDENGYVITHPDNSLIGTDHVANMPYWAEVSVDEEGFISYEFDGEEYFGSYVTNDLTKWKIMGTMTRAELTNDTNQLLYTVLILFIILTVVCIVSAISFTGVINKNIKELIAGFNKMDKGDLSARVTIKSKDEFSLLGAQFNEMVNNMGQIIGSVSQSSITVLDSATELASMSEETNSSASEVSRAVEEVAHGATEQAQSSTDAAMAVTNLSEKLDQINDATVIMNDLSENASKLTTEGLERVESLIDKSNSTKSSTAKVYELIMEMSNSMEKINTISDTIDMITEQTNLLSLNASIEAARSGEAGKGFAVVANEIRKLAEQSRQSTVQIKETINEIHEKTEQSVEAMNKTADTVKEQTIEVDQTQHLFADIKNAVGYLSEHVGEIRNFTTEINSMKENIVSQIENISAVSEETASASEEVTASTEQIASTMDQISEHSVSLSHLAEDLKKKVAHFTV